MPHRRPAGAAASADRVAVLDRLKEEHKRVRRAYRAFLRLDVGSDPQAAQAIVQQVLDELTVHAALEEELLYPAAHDALDDEHLVDEAEVEHETLHALIDQLHGMSADEEKYAARFTVLCEYVLHHAREEEGRLFPALAAASLDWATLAAALQARRRELMPMAAQGGEDAAPGRPTTSLHALEECEDSSVDDPGATPLHAPDPGPRLSSAARTPHAGNAAAASPRRARTA